MKAHHPAPWIVSSQALVLKFFGVSPRVLERWRLEGAPGKRGHYDLSQLYRWREERRQRLEALKPKTPKDRLALARARSVEHDLQVRRKKYTLTREVLEYTNRLCETFRSSLGALGLNLADQLQGLDLHEQRALIQSRCGELLQDMLATNPTNGAPPVEGLNGVHQEDLDEHQEDDSHEEAQEV